MEKKLLLSCSWMLYFTGFRGVPDQSHQCPASLAVPGASAELYQLQLWSFVGKNYLRVNLHHSLLKVVQVLVNV